MSPLLVVADRFVAEIAPENALPAPVKFTVRVLAVITGVKLTCCTVTSESDPVVRELELR